MVIEFTEFVGKAPRLEAIQVTAENVEELAVWMGADTYSVSKILVGGERKVTFSKLVKHERPNFPDHVREIVRTRIGDWVIQIPSGVANERGSLYETDERFRSYTQKEIDSFVKQQHNTGEVDLTAPPYDR